MKAETSYNTISTIAIQKIKQLRDILSTIK